VLVEIQYQQPTFLSRLATPHYFRLASCGLFVLCFHSYSSEETLEVESWVCLSIMDRAALALPPYHPLYSLRNSWCQGNEIARWSDSALCIKSNKDKIVTKIVMKSLHFL